MTPAQLTNYLDVVFKKQSKHSTFICSEHGLGKSSIVKTVAAKNGYTVIDFRLAQVESLDVAGMYYPTELNGVTSLTNLAPTYYQDMINSALANKGESKVCLFLDELNMARRETMNSAFEVILDRTVKGKKIPDDVIVICAGNPEHEDYDTTTMSESLKDRLIHVYLTADRNDFVNWAQSNEIHSDVIQFARSGHMTYKDLSYRAKLTPSSRSLARLSDLLKLGFDKAVEDEVILGVLGVELGVQFIKNRQQPEKAFDAEEMMSFSERPDSFKKFKEYCNVENTRLDILDASIANFYTFVKANNVVLTDSQVHSINMFMLEIPGELLYKFWKDIDTDHESTYASHLTVESITVPIFDGRLSALKDRLMAMSAVEYKTEDVPF